MNRELRDKWVAALRSGEYKQARGWLSHKGGYCCLGVLCDVAGLSRNHRDPVEFVFNDAGRDDDEMILGALRKDVDGDGDYAKRLAELNDNGASFDEIADYIEAHIPIDEESR
jgi:hypothetical protein